MTRDVQKQGVQMEALARAEWLKGAQTQAVFAALEARGAHVRAVGGAVRNTIFGLPVSDIDLATTSLPQETMQLAQEAGYKALPTGIDHGTVTILADKGSYEVTTLRKDVATDGRRAVIAYTDDWAEDALRRDFTFNALYAGRDGTLHDPLGGYQDALARRVRFIGSADARIEEDYLRILRFFRIYAAYGEGPLDEGGLAACVRGRGGLRQLSAERIQVELLKLLAAQQMERAITAMFDNGLLQQVVGGAPRITRLFALAQLERDLERMPDALLRLAALSVQTHEDAALLSRRLRLSNQQAKRLEAMADTSWQLPQNEQEARRALYRSGEESYIDLLLLKWAHEGEMQRALYDLPQSWTVPQFPLTGADLMARGIEAGPELGVALRASEARWVESNFTLGREELLQAVGRP